MKEIIEDKVQKEKEEKNIRREKERKARTKYTVKCFMECYKSSQNLEQYGIKS